VQYEKDEYCEVNSLPLCDICERLPASYDTKTLYGPWGYLCQVCYPIHGAGRLGEGYGKKLVLKEIK
jgi:hypothetical protein